jgi:hypothetical protein
VGEQEIEGDNGRDRAATPPEKRLENLKKDRDSPWAATSFYIDHAGPPLTRQGLAGQGTTPEPAQPAQQAPTLPPGPGGEVDENLPMGRSPYPAQPPTQPPAPLSAVELGFPSLPPRSPPAMEMEPPPRPTAAQRPGPSRPPGADRPDSRSSPQAAGNEAPRPHRSGSPSRPEQTPHAAERKTSPRTPPPAR